MKALSVRQPWANAIMLGKDVENRSRYFSHRGPLLIHASQAVDRDALRDRRILRLPKNVLVFGHLIGVVTMTDCVRTHTSKWADGDSWKLVLTNARWLSHPVPYSGNLGLFDVSETLLSEVLPEGWDLLPAGYLPLR